MVLDVRRNKVAASPVITKGAEVERVKTYKYLGIVLDNVLEWKENTDIVLKRDHSRVYCLRKLASFGVRSQLLQMVFTSMVSSILPMI